MKISKYLKPTSVNDLDYIAPRLRQADRNECLAATGKEPLGILYQSLMLGDITLTMRTPEGERVGLCGVAPSPLNGAGVVWMCATDAILNHQMAFLRRSKDALTYLSDGYSVLHNCVDARNEIHIKWLKWMGFTFLNRHEKYGAEQRPFYEFMRITNV